jgi:hypothetical protein
VSARTDNYMIYLRDQLAPMSMSQGEADVPGKKAPAYVCDTCGVQKPGVEVFQCTVCLKDFCVNHLEPGLHHCYQNE